MFNLCMLHWTSSPITWHSINSISSWLGDICPNTNLYGKSWVVEYFSVFIQFIISVNQNAEGTLALRTWSCLYFSFSATTRLALSTRSCDWESLGCQWTNVTLQDFVLIGILHNTSRSMRCIMDITVSSVSKVNYIHLELVQEFTFHNWAQLSQGSVFNSSFSVCCGRTSVHQRIGCKSRRIGAENHKKGVKMMGQLHIPARHRPY